MTQIIDTHTAKDKITLYIQYVIAHLTNSKIRNNYNEAPI